MAVYDTFLFHGEGDILELRLNILGDVVDKFVICEAKQSFNEQPCPSYYLEHKDRYKKWEDKIIHYQFDLMEDKDLVEQARNSPNTERGNPYWMKVYYAMETLRKPLEAVCKDKDIIFISDVDEIWNPKIIVPSDDFIHGFGQLVYYYQLNNRCSEPWTGSIRTTYRRLKQEIVNNIKQKGDVYVTNGGWHFTYQGGEKMVRRKVDSSKSPYPDKNDSYYGVPTDYIIERMKENKDIFPDHFRPTHRFWIEEENWPTYLKENREKYLHLLKN